MGVNKNFMATITLTYNARSSKARMVLDMLMSTGLFKKKEEKPNAETMAAIKEAQSGKHAEKGRNRPDRLANMQEWWTSQV